MKSLSNLYTFIFITYTDGNVIKHWVLARITLLNCPESKTPQIHLKIRKEVGMICDIFRLGSHFWGRRLEIIDFGKWNFTTADMRNVVQLGVLLEVILSSREACKRPHSENDSEQIIPALPGLYAWKRFTPVIETSGWGSSECSEGVWCHCLH